MKVLSTLFLAAFSVAFVIPDQRVFLEDVTVESTSKPKSSDFFEHHLNKDQAFDEVKQSFAKAVKTSKDVFDHAIEYTEKRISQGIQDAASGVQSWLESDYSIVNSQENGYGHHHPGHLKPNKTVYQLIAESKYTTKLAKLINEYDDLVVLLNGTKANYTVFAPVDSAFDKIPEDAPKPSKEDLKKVLLYHVSSEFYPAGRVLVTHTIPSSLSEKTLGGRLQRLSTNIGLRGLTVNFYSRIIAIDIFGTNGVIHGVEDILIPPPTAADIITYLPGEFSTLELGLRKTGLLEVVNNTANHVGGTLFAPSNFAFQILGPQITGFLFSDHGLKYLKALLKYHIVANHTLYSDAYYNADHGHEAESSGIPKGLFHVDLPTILDDKILSIDIGRFGRLISIKINGFSQVTIEDGIAKDGVIQVVSNVLIPPKPVGGLNKEWHGEELSPEDLMARLDPLVEKEDL